MCNCYMCSRDRKVELDEKKALKRGLEVFNEIIPNQIKTAQDLQKFDQWLKDTSYNHQSCDTLKYFINREMGFGYNTLEKIASADLYATIPQRFGGKYENI